GVPLKRILFVLLLLATVLDSRHVLSQAARTVNRPPTAHAGPDQTVPAIATILLNGAASTDADGDPLTYSWTLVSRPAESLASVENPTSVRPSLRVDTPGNYVVRLIVNDGSVDSAPAMVTISRTNSKPVARAGRDQTVTPGT